MYTTSMHLVYTVLFLLVMINMSTTGGPTSKLLILGGNGMLGSATVRSLLTTTTTEYDITILNRGNWYWDTEKIIKPYVTHIQCTRGDGFRESCTPLHEATFDTIIDFSSYDPLDVEDILILLGGKFKRYIYISTDSVYEVCKPKTHEGYSIEDDDVRPEDEIESARLNEKDNYGHQKLECEEVLRNYHVEFNYDFIFLRLPDVLGPRDNTIRFYKYFIWTKLHQVIGPVHIPKKFQEIPLSFVYSIDVGTLISSLANSSYNSNVFNHAYNLGFERTITLKEFITVIGDWLKHGETQFDESEEAHINYGFPSVTRGPLDISKARAMLNWSPSDLSTALGEICNFYETMQYAVEHKHVLDRVLDLLDVRGDKYRDFIDIHHRKLKLEL